MASENYRPTYIWFFEQDGTTVDLYCDTLIIKRAGKTHTFVAHGDGYHITKISVETNGILKTCDIAYHGDQLANALKDAEAVIAVKDHRIVYSRTNEARA